MFEKFISDINNKPEEEKFVLDLTKNPTINKEFLRYQLNNSLDNIPDAELFNLVKETYPHILETIMDNNDAQYIDAFMNPKFLSVFIQVLSGVQLDLLQRTCCNKLAYDYFTLKNNDRYIKQLFYSLSKMVNRDIIPSLLSLGIPENLAIQIALARYSSTKETVNVKRVNFIITTSPKEIMTLQTIIWIYEKLFDSFTPIFEGTMFDVYDDEEEWVTDDIMEIYSTISLAVLEILNNMPSVNIRKVLISYTGDFETLHSKKLSSYRFSMSALSGDYERINNVVEALKAERIYVP